MSLTVQHIDGPLAGLSQHFDDLFDEILFGRSQEADVVYPPECKIIGEYHCKLRRTKVGRYIIMRFDVQYVEVDGTPIRDVRVLRSGNTLRLASPEGPSFKVAINQVAEPAAPFGSPTGSGRRSPIPPTGLPSVEPPARYSTVRRPTVRTPARPSTRVGGGAGSALSVERAPEPKMDEILASVRKIISDDEQKQAAAAAAPQTDREEVSEGEADYEIINDIARVLSGKGVSSDAPMPVQSAMEAEEDILDLTAELGALEPIEEAEAASAEPPPPQVVQSVPARPQVRSEAAPEPALDEAPAINLRPPMTASEDATSALERAIAAFRAEQLPTSFSDFISHPVSQPEPVFQSEPVVQPESSAVAVTQLQSLRLAAEPTLIRRKPGNRRQGRSKNPSSNADFPRRLLRLHPFPRIPSSSAYLDR